MCPDVQLDGVVADVERARDGLVALAARQVVQDLPLALGERGQQAVAAGRLGAGLQHLRELERHRRRDHQFTSCRRGDRLDHVLGLHVLEQVAAHPGAQRGGEVGLAVAHGQDQRRRLYALGAQLAQQRQAIDGRHAQVQHQQVGALLAQHRRHLGGVADGGQHVHAAALAQQVRQPGAAQGMVVDKHDARRRHQCTPMPARVPGRRGNSTRMQVPPPSRGPTCRWPPSRRARSRMMLRP
jgi:hypothetical protein